MARPRLSLAEFMIATAILGVVAATVVPALVRSTQRTATAAEQRRPALARPTEVPAAPSSRVATP